MWQYVEHSIARLITIIKSSHKAAWGGGGGYVAQFYSPTNRFKMIYSQLSICGVVTAEIKTDEMHLDRQTKIKRRRFDALLITRTTWLHLNGPSEIQQARLNHNNSHSCVSLELLIKD